MCSPHAHSKSPYPNSSLHPPPLSPSPSSPFSLSLAADHPSALFHSLRDLNPLIAYFFPALRSITLSSLFIFICISFFFCHFLPFFHYFFSFFYPLLFSSFLSFWLSSFHSSFQLHFFLPSLLFPPPLFSFSSFCFCCYDCCCCSSSSPSFLLLLPPLVLLSPVPPLISVLLYSSLSHLFRPFLFFLDAYRISPSLAPLQISTFLPKSTVFSQLGPLFPCSRPCSHRLFLRLSPDYRSESCRSLRVLFSRNNHSISLSVCLSISTSIYQPMFLLPYLSIIQNIIRGIRTMSKIFSAVCS